MGGAEQRKHKRSKNPFEGMIDSSDASIQTMIVNISCTGILCSTETPVPEMIAVDLTIELPTAQFQHFEVEGTVVRCYEDDENPGGYLVAILFKNLDQGVFETIRTYVEFDNPLDEE